ncbi:hypothetical protein [Nocardia sp. NPDC051832]|uniref:hypothetical protein n=1 Tax=Nocardia sp. NPDC051832 TaxID=3155673 RepID=UPI00342E0E37
MSESASGQAKAHVQEERATNGNAFAAGWLGASGVPAMVLAAVNAHSAAQDFSGADPVRGEMCDAITWFFGSSALLLGVGVVLLISGSRAGRALVAVGSGAALMGHGVGIAALAFVTEPDTVTYIESPMLSVFFYGFLVFPVATIWCAALSSR